MMTMFFGSTDVYYANDNFSIFILIKFPFIIGINDSVSSKSATVQDNPPFAC